MLSMHTKTNKLLQSVFTKVDLLENNVQATVSDTHKQGVHMNEQDNTIHFLETKLQPFEDELD